MPPLAPPLCTPKTKARSQSQSRPPIAAATTTARPEPMCHEPLHKLALHRVVRIPRQIDGRHVLLQEGARVPFTLCVALVACWM